MGLVLKKFVFSKVMNHTDHKIEVQYYTLDSFLRQWLVRFCQVLGLVIKKFQYPTYKFKQKQLVPYLYFSPRSLVFTLTKFRGKREQRGASHYLTLMDNSQTFQLISLSYLSGDNLICFQFLVCGTLALLLGLNFKA